MASQYAALEEPGLAERPITLSVAAAPAAITAAALAVLKAA
jgi:gluconate kinase